MFRFSIRDVLWLTVVVALAVGWLRSEGLLRAERRKCLHIEGDILDYIQIEDALNALPNLVGSDEKQEKDRAALVQRANATKQSALDRAVRKVRRSMSQ